MSVSASIKLSFDFNLVPKLKHNELSINFEPLINALIHTNEIIVDFNVGFFEIKHFCTDNPPRGVEHNYALSSVFPALFYYLKELPQRKKLVCHQICIILKTYRP